MKIDSTPIGNSFEPYVIAEMSGNHLGSYEMAEELLTRSSTTGIQAFKLQTYTPDSLTINCNKKEYIVADGPWKGRNLYELYSQGSTPEKWIPDLFKTAKELGISIFSTPFSLRDVDILEENNVSAYKIASFEINYVQLLKYIAQTKKPVIFSTGLATLEEIDFAYETLISNGATEISILKCTTTYPATPEMLNLTTIPHLIQKYQIPIGFSDHTIGITAATAAVALGATVLEKHVKLDEDNQSVDASFALPVSRLTEYVDSAKFAAASRGIIQDGPTQAEKPYLKYRRSVVAAKTIESGKMLDEKDLVVVRPNIGVPPAMLEKLLGKVVNRRIEFGEGIAESDLSIRENNE